MTRTVLDLWVGLLSSPASPRCCFCAKVGSTRAVSTSNSYEVVARFDNIVASSAWHRSKAPGVVGGRWRISVLQRRLSKAAVTLRLDKPLCFFLRTPLRAIMTSGCCGETICRAGSGRRQPDIEGQDRILITQSAVVLRV